MSTSELLAHLRRIELRLRHHRRQEAKVVAAAIRYVERSEQRIENIARGSSVLLVQAAELVGEQMTGRKG